uniref:Uncharacterized protein n=1 Tax=Setaria viridis TaxID=4556 RepID=A0A4U6T0J7_SETVI|nr:hypothetical protein SEVIR_9G330850v2 [Setaria viridis]
MRARRRSPRVRPPLLRPRLPTAAPLPTPPLPTYAGPPLLLPLTCAAALGRTAAAPPELACPAARPAELQRATVLARHGGEATRRTAAAPSGSSDGQIDAPPPRRASPASKSTRRRPLELTLRPNRRASVSSPIRGSSVRANPPLAPLLAGARRSLPAPRGSSHVAG